MKGFLTGLGLGAAIGIWLAPEAGSETRKKLMTRGADLAERLGNKGEAKLADDGEARRNKRKRPHRTLGCKQAIIKAKQHNQASNNQETQSTQDPVARS